MSHKFESSGTLTANWLWLIQGQCFWKKLQQMQLSHFHTWHSFGRFEPMEIKMKILVNAAPPQGWFCDTRLLCCKFSLNAKRIFKKLIKRAWQQGWIETEKKKKPSYTSSEWSHVGVQLCSTDRLDCFTTCFIKLTPNGAMAHRQTCFIDMNQSNLGQTI